VRGIRRTIGTAPNSKEPLTAERVRAMVKSTPNSLSGLRDRALLLLGFAGAMRRSELVGLNVNDLKDTKVGLRIYIRTSKTDQERLGQIIAIAPGKIVCPVKALREWMVAAKIRARTHKSSLIGCSLPDVLYGPDSDPILQSSEMLRSADSTDLG
jgi:site-specific recombinase XerD